MSPGPLVPCNLVAAGAGGIRAMKSSSERTCSDQTLGHLRVHEPEHAVVVHEQVQPQLPKPGW